MFDCAVHGIGVNYRHSQTAFMPAAISTSHAAYASQTEEIWPPMHRQQPVLICVYPWPIVFFVVRSMESA